MDLSRGRLEMMLKVLDVDGAVRRVSGGWAATGQAVGLRRRALRAGGRRARPASSRRCSATIATDGCRMEYLRRELDDPAAAPCGRCDNCTGRRWPRRRCPRPALPRRGSGCSGPGVEVEPRTDVADRDEGAGRRRRRQDPAELIGRARPGPRPAHRHRLGRPAARPAARRAAAPPTRQRRLDPDDLVAAVVKVLAAWDWAQRPAGVITLPSRSRPQLIEQPRPAARRRSAGCPTSARSPTPDGARPRRRASTTARSGCASLWHALEVPDDVRGRRRQPRTARCCWSTTGSRPAGR